MTTTKVITNTVRGTYLALSSPKKDDKTGEEKYGMAILIPKTDKVTLNAIKGAQQTAAEKKWGAKLPPKINYTLHDGDGVKPEAGTPYGPECKGHYVMNVGTKNRPGVVDQNVRPILDPTALVSGDYFRVEINAYGYENKGKCGVSFGLNNVQLVKKGDPLGNTSRAEDVFSSVAEDEAYA